MAGDAQRTCAQRVQHAQEGFRTGETRAPDLPIGDPMGGTGSGRRRTGVGYQGVEGTGAGQTDFQDPVGLRVQAGGLEVQGEQREGSVGIGHGLMVDAHERHSLTLPCCVSCMRPPFRKELMDTANTPPPPRTGSRRSLMQISGRSRRCASAGYDSATPIRQARP